jgi:DNA repair protein RadC
LYLKNAPREGTMESMYRKYLIRLRVVRESRAKLKQINSPQAVVECIKKEMQSLDREYVVAVLLDTRNNVIGIEELAKGTINTAPICSREVFKAAVLCNAQAFILFHNHPSGDPTPSTQDIEATRLLKKASAILEVNLIDHIIVGSNGTYLSMKEKGVL